MNTYTVCFFGHREIYNLFELEEKLEELDTEMTACASQYSRLTELTEEKETVQQALDEKMERWMYLTELNKKIQAQK